MNKYPRVGSIMFRLSPNRQAIQRVKVLKGDNEGGINVIDCAFLKAKAWRDIQDDEIKAVSFKVSLNDLAR